MSESKPADGSRRGAAPLPPVIDPDRLQAALREGGRFRILDVRTPAEFEGVHIRGAYNVPLDTLAEHGEELRRTVDEPVVLVCRSGARARRAERSLRESGMESLHILDGGMAAWESAGHEVERGRARWGLERQVRFAAGLLILVGTLGGALVWPPLVWLAAFVGGGLVFSGVTDTCGMALLLSRLPYNRAATCEVEAVVRALSAGRPAPAATGE